MPELLIFELDTNRFGIVAGDVVEAIRAVFVAALPQAPAIVEGVINLRGRIVPVLDIRKRFRLPLKSLELSDHMVIARASERVVALRVDRVSEFVTVAEQDIVRAVDISSVGEMVKGVANLADGLVVIHDLSAFLTGAEGDALDALTA